MYSYVDVEKIRQEQDNSWKQGQHVEIREDSKETC